MGPFVYLRAPAVSADGSSLPELFALAVSYVLMSPANGIRGGCVPFGFSC